MLASHAGEALKVKPTLDGGELTTLEGTEAGQGVTLGPFGIRVFRVNRRRGP